MGNPGVKSLLSKLLQTTQLRSETRERCRVMDSWNLSLAIEGYDVAEMRMGAAGFCSLPSNIAELFNCS